MMEAAIQVKPFGFDRVFRLATADPAVPGHADHHKQTETLQAEIDRLTHEREADLARARTDGFEAGLVQARRERAAALLSATDALHAAIDDIDTRLAGAADVMMREAAEMALAAAEVLAGHAIDHAPARAIDEALGRALQQVGRGTPLIIRVNPALAADVERAIALRVSQERRKLTLTVIGDETVAEGDAEIFWDEGGIGVDAAVRRAAVMTELGALCARNTDA